MTALYSDIIFGPIHSRRLGLSLGVNLLPTQSKLCSFDCIYCECGWNAEHPGARRFNSREDVRTMLGATLRQMVSEGTPPDVITFAGNGEPTMHPDFEAIIDDTIVLRDEICPSARISVLSNATQIGRESVRRALRRVDNNILKLDSAFDDTVRLINNPCGTYSVAEVVKNMKLFDGQMILQTMFLRGECEGRTVDNTTEREVAAWLKLVEEIRPRQVMVYSLDRDTPCKPCRKSPAKICRRSLPGSRRWESLLGGVTQRRATGEFQAPSENLSIGRYLLSVLYRGGEDFICVLLHCLLCSRWHFSHVTRASGRKRSMPKISWVGGVRSRSRITIGMIRTTMEPVMCPCIWGL